jgi:ligand-binding sensor domain-containing protein
MLSWVPLLVALQCVVADEPPVAQVTLPDGRIATASPSALRVGTRVFTACDGLPSAQPSALTVRQGRLVIGFRAGGVFELVPERIDGHLFVRLPGPPAPVRALAAEGARLYIGTNAGLWQLDGAGPARRVDHPVLRRREITALELGRDGALHVGAGPYGWWRRGPDGKTRLVRAVYAGCFAEGPRGVEPRAPGPQCTPAHHPTGGLPSSHVTALEHFDGHLYVGSFDHGLYRKDGATWARIEGIPPFVNALAADRDQLWIGTPKGLYRLKDQLVGRIELGLPGEHVNGLSLGARGTVHVATGQGLVELTPTGGVRLIDEHAGLPSRICYAVTETKDGAIWVATAGGVARLGDGVQLYSQTSGALPHDWVTSLLPDGDAVLAGTYDAGVARLTPDGRGARLPGLERAWVNPNGLYRAGDRLLIMTLGDGLLVSTTTHTEVVHLPADDVTAVAPDGAHLWIGTRAGLVRTQL